MLYSESLFTLSGFDRSIALGFFPKRTGHCLTWRTAPFQEPKVHLQNVHFESIVQGLDACRSGSDAVTTESTVPNIASVCV